MLADEKSFYSWVQNQKIRDSNKLKKIKMSIEKISFLEKGSL
jgi:hypothetical protein